MLTKNCAPFPLASILSILLLDVFGSIFSYPYVTAVFFYANQANIIGTS